MAAERRAFVKNVANVVLFQLGWLASVLGAAHGSSLAGPLAVGLIVAIHLRWLGARREWLLLVASAALGTVAESALALAGLTVYRSDPPPSWLCPPWITAMWANFAVTLRHSLRWLAGRWVLAFLLGAVFGPLAYVAGARLGAIELSRPFPAVVALGLVWAIALPGLLRFGEEIKSQIGFPLCRRKTRQGALPVVGAP